MKLQQFLNDTPDLRVAPAGSPGSAGMETMYYGPATAAAVSKMQVMFRAEVLTPGGLVNPTGYFGSMSRAKANDLCVADATTDEVDDAEDATDEEEDDNEEMTLQGEGTLATLEVDDEEDEVQEGAEDVVVASLTLEAENGDVELSRVTMTLVDAGGTVNDERDPWDVFEEVSLWIDGDKVASFEADDEDNYLDEDAGEFRFSNLDLFLGEDDEVEVLVAVSVLNSVDGAGSPALDTADWNITPTEVRYFDADGVATTEDGTWEDLGVSVEFDIVEEGFDDGADIEGSSNDPDASTLKVDNGSDESDEFTTHVFEIEVDEDSSDLVVNDVWYAVTMTNPDATDITGGQAEVLNEITMTIDGVTVEGEAVEGTETNVGPDEEDDQIDGSGGTTTVHYLFEFDEDVELEADETYDVEVTMTFEGQNGNYANGVLLEGTASGAIWEVEGLDSDFTLTGSDTSQEHTLADSVPVISGVDSDVTADDPNDSGTISWSFNVEADDEDVTFGVVNNLDVDGAADDVQFTISGTDSGIATATLTLIDGDATYDAGTDLWTINDGDDATFALDVTFTTVDAGDNGTYRVNLDRVGGVEVDENSAGLSLSN